MEKSGEKSGEDPEHWRELVVHEEGAVGEDLGKGKGEVDVRVGRICLHWSGG